MKVKEILITGLMISFIFAYADEIDNYKLLSIVRDVIEEEGWYYTKDPNNTSLQMKIETNQGIWRCYAWTREEDKQFIFYSEVQDTFPSEKKCEVMEYISRVNQGLIIGNFEVDLRKKKIRYKTSIDVTGGFLTKSMAKNLIETNLMMMDKYIPWLYPVIAGEMSPEKAALRAEGIIIEFEE